MWVSIVGGLGRLHSHRCRYERKWNVLSGSHRRCGVLYCSCAPRPSGMMRREKLRLGGLRFGLGLWLCGRMMRRGRLQCSNPGLGKGCKGRRGSRRARRCCDGLRPGSRSSLRRSGARLRAARGGSCVLGSSVGCWSHCGAVPFSPGRRPASRPASTRWAIAGSFYEIRWQLRPVSGNTEFCCSPAPHRQPHAARRF